MNKSRTDESDSTRAKRKAPPSPAGLSKIAGLLDYLRQSGNPAASGGLVALEAEPVADELVLLLVLPVLGLVLLPVLVLGLSFRTCLATGSQHRTVLDEDAAPGEVVVLGV